MCVVSGRMELLPSFLRARLSAAAATSLSSPCLLEVLLQGTPPPCTISTRTHTHTYYVYGCIV